MDTPLVHLWIDLVELGAGDFPGIFRGFLWKKQKNLSQRGFAV